jgi:hypothetical protein
VTATEARLELERANTWLRLAVENALEMKAAASEIPASLERIADSVNTVAGASLQGEMQLLKPELDVLRSRMRQLQTLLDSAAAFYCACIARSRGIETNAYTAGGMVPATPAIHQLVLNA